MLACKKKCQIGDRINFLIKSNIMSYAFQMYYLILFLKVVMSCSVFFSSTLYHVIGSYAC